MIGKLSQNQKANWPKHLLEIIQAYNRTHSAIMGFSPHYLLFGYHPRFPVDLLFPTIRKRHVIHVDSYVAMLQQHLAKALDEASHQNIFEAHWQKRYYDHHSGTVMLKPRDIVLLKMDGYTGRRNTKYRWSNEHYTILHQLGPDILTYKIETEIGISSSTLMRGRTPVCHW